MQAPTCPGKLALPTVYKAFLSLAAAWSEMKGFHISRPWDKARFFLRTSRKPVGLLGGEGGAYTPEGSWSELCALTQRLQQPPPPHSSRVSPTLGLVGKCVARYGPVTVGLNSPLNWDCLQIASRSAAQVSGYLCGSGFPQTGPDGGLFGTVNVVRADGKV